MITINKAEHKLIIYKAFQDERGAEKRFPVVKLKEASSLMKKLLDCAEAQKDENGALTGWKWDNSNLELVLDEAVFLKEQLNAMKEAAPSEFENLESLKELLDEKPEKGK